MSRTSAELSRGRSTTAPETTAEAGTAPAALAPTGMRGAASIRCSPTGPADLAADADDAGNSPIAAVTSNARTGAVHGALQRRPAGPALRLARQTLRPTLPLAMTTFLPRVPPITSQSSQAPLSSGEARNEENLA